VLNKFAQHFSAMSKTYVNLISGSTTHTKLLTLNDDELCFLACWTDSTSLLSALQNPTPDVVWAFVRRLLSAPDVKMEFPLTNQYHFVINV